MSRRRLLLVVPVLVVVAVVGGTWLYLNVLRDDPPEEFSLDDIEPADDDEDDDAAPDPSEGIEGEWRIGPGSAAGYRVPETLLGQPAEAVGRTSEITGTASIEGADVTAAEFTVDMASIRSDDSRRDGQFRGRIMDVEKFPTSTFTLTEPIALGTAPVDGARVTVDAVGELTLRGTTRTVTIALEAEVDGDAINIVGSLPIVFDDWGIPNPSTSIASVGGEGVLELLVVLVR